MNFIMLLQEGVNISDPSQLIVLLNPIIVYLAIEVAKLVKTIVPTWLLGLAVPLLSAAGAYLVNMMFDANFVVTFALGFASTFIYELVKRLKGKTSV